MTINKRGRPIGTTGPDRGLSFAHAIQLRSDNPDMTLEAIGNIVGVTKERVRQLLKKAGMETRSAKAIHARRPPHLKFGKPCPTCDKPVPYRQKESTNLSPSHGYYPMYHIECRPGSLFVDLVCPYCHKSFQLPMYDYNQKMKHLNNGSQKDLYCSHSCVSNAYWDEVREFIPNEHDYVQKTERNQAPRTSFTCGICRTEVRLRLREYIHRIKKSKAGILLCSRACTHQWIKKV